VPAMSSAQRRRLAARCSQSELMTGINASTGRDSTFSTSSSRLKLGSRYSSPQTRSRPSTSPAAAPEATPTPQATPTPAEASQVDEAEKSCGKLAGVINELSDISKLDAGLVKLARQRLDLFALVGEVAELVQEARDRDVRLEVRGDASGAVISGDATRLRQAFDAIFRAIVREKPGPATVIAERRLEARDGVTSAVVVVADESSVQLAYERAAGPFNEKRGGLGLALPLARRVIEGHGGRLWSPEPTDVVPEDGETRDPLARGSAIVSVPVTE